MRLSVVVYTKCLVADFEGIAVFDRMAGPDNPGTFCGTFCQSIH